MVWSCFPFIRSGQNHLARHSERGKKTRRTKEEVGRQHQGMDRPGVRKVPEGSGEQGKMEKTGCKIICGAPTTLAVKGLMMMMMNCSKFQWKMNSLRSRSRSQRRFELLVNVYMEDFFWTTEHLVTKPDMVMQHHKPECHPEKLVHCDQCQGHSEGLYNQNMTISVVSSKLQVGLQPNLVSQYSIMSWSVLWKNGITAFKVKVTAEVQNVGECLSRW